jgi:hypothetical protein
MLMERDGRARVVFLSKIIFHIPTHIHMKNRFIHAMLGGKLWHNQ